MLPCLGMVFAAGACDAAAAHAQDIRLNEPVRISRDSTVRHAETVIAVDPRNHRNLIAAAIELRTPTNTAVYASRDGGLTWIRARAPGGALADSSDDPAFAFDARGRAYYLARATDMRVRRSLDGGRSWDAGVVVPGRAHDRPWLYVDPAEDRLHVIAKVPVVIVGSDESPDLIAISRDVNHRVRNGALKLSGPRLILPGPPAKDRWLYIVSDVANGPGKSVVATAFDCEMPAPGAVRLGCHFIALIAPQGGWRFTERRTIAEVELHTWANPWTAARAAYGGRIAVDRSNGATRDRIYATWTELQGGRMNIVVASSADSGKTWSKPVTVNDDTTRSSHANPGIAVNPNGVVGIVWNDRRADAADECFQPYVAASFDGGRTFTRNRSLATELACTVTPAGKPEPERFANGGDTFGIAATSDGSFHAIWVGGRHWQLYTTRIDVTGR